MSARMPNGWPAPDFLGVADDGDFFVEWIWDDARLCFRYSPDDGALAILTPAGEQVGAEGAEAVRLVAATLGARSLAPHAKSWTMCTEHLRIIRDEDRGRCPECNGDRNLIVVVQSQ